MNVPSPTLALVCLSVLGGPLLASEAPTQEGATITNAVPFGAVPNTFRYRGALDVEVPELFFTFTVTNPVQSVDIDLSDAFFGASLSLLAWPDRNRPPVEYAASEQGQFRGASVTQWLEAGEYFVRVGSRSTPSTTAPFTLDLTYQPRLGSLGSRDNSPATALRLGALFNAVSLTDWLGTSDTIDYVRFDVIGHERIVRLNVEPNEASVRVELFAWAEENRDPQSITAAESPGGFQGNGVLLEELLAPGHYLVGIGPTTQLGSSEYALRMSQTLPDNTAPFLLAPLESVVAKAGTTVRWDVRADGSGLLSYQWEHNGSPIRGATNSVLEIVNVARSDEGTYAVRIGSGLDSLLTDPLSLTLEKAALELSIVASVTLSWSEVVDQQNIASWVLEQRRADGSIWSESVPLFRGVADGRVYASVPLQSTNGLLFRLRAP